jgi:hypothetical protein
MNWSEVIKESAKTRNKENYGGPKSETHKQNMRKPKSSEHRKKLGQTNYERNRKQVSQICQATRQTIQTFSSVKEAAMQFNNTNADRSIAACANGRQRTAYGFAWKYQQ